MGALLKSTPSSFFLYEPEKFLQDPRDDLQGINISARWSVELLSELFKCNLTREFAKFALGWKAAYEPPQGCAFNYCYNESYMRSRCNQAGHIIFKTVRLRLEDTEELLSHAELSDLKIVYLVRDPRGVLTSIEELRRNRHWNLTTEYICSKLRRDLQSYDYLSQRFPKRVLLLSYENVTQDLLGATKYLWRFLQDDSTADPPSEWLNFLNASASSPATLRINDPFDIQHKSPKNFQKWRQSISEKLLLETEVLCYDVISTLGFRHFKSLSLARNTSFDLSLKGIEKDHE